MTNRPANDQPNDAAPALLQPLIQSLRRKEGNWVTWGRACQQLQQSGLSQQQIFEETGFEPVQQNQITVAMQVYDSLTSGGAASEVLTRFEQTGSDSLYELRVLNQSERVAAASLIVEKGIDSEGAHEVAKALKDFARLSRCPDEFAAYPHDAVAHTYWKLAKQQSDLQARSRLIALALRFAKSDSARQQVERLLTDFSVSPTRSAPRLPFYRLESASEQPHILPVVGKLPLTITDWQAVPSVTTEGVFQVVKFSGVGAWVALPGWQVVQAAEDAVIVVADSDQLPDRADLSDEPVEELLLMIDRAIRDWDINHYSLIMRDQSLQLSWSEEPPNVPILGRLVLVLRPKRVLDEAFNKELWQIEE